MQREFRTALSVLVCLAVLLVAVEPGFTSGRPEFSLVDRYAVDAPREAMASIKELADYLAKGAQTDIEKARAIYSWITRNIDYDVKTYASGNYGDQSAQHTLKTRMAVCQGYSSLFEALGEALSLEQALISGYSRGAGYLVGGRIDDKPNHTWNAVKIDGEWRLLDCTWGAGYIDAQERFVRQPCDHYFLTPPENFIYDHLPDDPKWQLLDNPIGKNDFGRMAFLRPAFFDCSLKLISEPASAIDGASFTTLAFEAPGDVLLSADVMRGKDNDEAASTLIQRDGDRLKLTASIPYAGNYTLRVYAKRRSDPGVYQWAADYKIDVSSDAPTKTAFPTTFSTFHDKNACLHTPMDGTLKSGSKESFKLTVPGAESVAVIVAGKWSKLDKHGDVFEGHAEIKGSDVSVAAKFPGSDSYFVLLKYSVS
ncbi:MAG: hypothetical protein M1133_00530 [Armatimonadetes bacterium]|nr:hypothetical protein [Armatimonadota bacterium]